MTDPRIGKWLLSLDTGVSSKSILAVMTGANPADIQGRADAPRDPADLGRCLRLLEIFPEWKPRLHEMARVSRRWQFAIACWEEIRQSMIDEVGIDWSKGRSAPMTYDLMKRRGL